jgi:hypothetical protein
MGDPGIPIVSPSVSEIVPAPVSRLRCLSGRSAKFLSLTSPSRFLRSASARYSGGFADLDKTLRFTPGLLEA